MGSVGHLRTEGVGKTPACTACGHLGPKRMVAAIHMGQAAELAVCCMPFEHATLPDVVVCERLLYRVLVLLRWGLVALKLQMVE